MRRSVIDVHILYQTTAETVFGKHTLHHLNIKGIVTGFEMLVERLLEENLGSGRTLSAGIAGVREVLAVGPLVAGELHFVGVDDDDVVTALLVGRVGRFVFAAQNFGDFGAKATENLVGGIDYHPFFLNLRRVKGWSFVA